MDDLRSNTVTCFSMQFIWTVCQSAMILCVPLITGQRFLNNCMPIRTVIVILHADCAHGLFAERQTSEQQRVKGGPGMRTLCFRLLVAGLMISMPAFAHHATRGSCDASNPITLNATVTDCSY